MGVRNHGDCAKCHRTSLLDVPVPNGECDRCRAEADTYQTIILVTADGQELLYVGRPQIDHTAPPNVVDIKATEPRPLPAGHEWATVTPESKE